MFEGKEAYIDSSEITQGAAARHGREAEVKISDEWNSVQLLRVLCSVCQILNWKSYHMLKNTIRTRQALGERRPPPSSTFDTYCDFIPIF